MKSDSTTRPYKQTARARAAAETADRILAAFMNHMEQSWFDEIRLEDIAADAGVTVQTVLRRFGSKEGLLASGQKKIEQTVTQGRNVPVGNIAKAIEVICAEYELLGSLVIRLLAQEERFAPIRATTDLGRNCHRQWVATVFAPWLETMPGEARERTVDRLVIALDVYVWKLLRIDMRHDKMTVARTMLNMCADALGIKTTDFESSRTLFSEAIDV